jgi:hypothetical protein
MMSMNSHRTPRQPLSLDRFESAFALAGAALLLSASVAMAATDSGPADEACWTTEPGVIGSIDHPTEPEAIVLRMFTGGGFVPLEIAFLESPVFTLFGNNVAIFRPSSESSDITDALPPYQCSRLSPEQVDELLTFALDDGGLRDAADLYADPFIADTPNTVFTIDAEDVAKDVVVQALGFNPDAPDQDARAQFQALADLLTDFAPGVTPSTAYEVPVYQGLLTDIWTGSPAPAIAWPWADLAPEDFTGDGFAVATLTPAQVAQVVPVPSGGQGFIVLELPDGSQRSFAVKPLLPDAIAGEASPA